VQRVNVNLKVASAWPNGRRGRRIGGGGGDSMAGGDVGQGVEAEQG
jgi:hypothetical protein